MNVLDTTWNVADIPLNVTLVVPLRLFPKMLIIRPIRRKFGVASTKGDSFTPKTVGSLLRILHPRKGLWFAENSWSPDKKPMDHEPRGGTG